MLNASVAPWPCFTDEEAEAARAVILSNRVNYWTGEEGRHFETEFADWVGTSHAVALANGTLALDLALNALEIGPDDEVIVTPRSFMASVYCVVNVGATPVFADVDAAAGRAALTTDFPGCLDAVISNVTGLIARVNDPIDLAEKMKLLIENRGLCRKMGANARLHAEKEFDVRQVVARHIAIYRDILELSPPEMAYKMLQHD